MEIDMMDELDTGKGGGVVSEIMQMHSSTINNGHSAVQHDDEETNCFIRVGMKSSMMSKCPFSDEDTTDILIPPVVPAPGIPLPGLEPISSASSGNETNDSRSIW
jgi:hypothetical protein